MGKLRSRSFGRRVAAGLVVSVCATTLVVAAAPAGAAPVADLAVTLSRSPSVGQAAVDPIRFTAVVTNDGPNPAQNVVFVDPLSQLGPAIQDAETTKGECEFERTQVTCAIGTLNSGASATVTIDLLIGRSGLVTNTVAVTSSTADPDDENNIASASVVMTEPPPFEELIVIGYFKLVLEIDPSEEQVERWLEELEEYDYYDGEYQLELLKSYTFRSLWVDETYQKLLGRTPDAGGLALFTRALSQRVTYEQIVATIAGSSEYYTKAGGSNGAWVDQVVQDLTGHPPPAAFRSELLDKLAGGASRTEAAYRVSTSGLGRLAWLKWQYRRYFGREGASFELNNGVFQLFHGTRPAWLLANLLTHYEIIESFLPGYYYEWYSQAQRSAKAV